MTRMIDKTTLLKIHREIHYLLQHEQEQNAELDGSNNARIKELEILLDDIRNKLGWKPYKISWGIKK